MPSSTNPNLAHHLALMAAASPARVAIKIPRGRTSAGDIDYLALTFAELDAEVSAWTARLSDAGVARGDRTLLMVRQGLPLIASAFGLLRLGAVPVLIDPGMGLKNFLAAVAATKPRVLVGIPFAQLVSRLYRPTFRSVKIRVWASGSLTARLSAASAIVNHKSEIVNSAPTDLAAILFTSGTTGKPKGVCYEHGMFDAQVRLIRETYAIAPGEIDLPLLPIFALFNPALGMTTIVPEMDPRRPADLDPAKIVRAIRQENVTNSFGSPTLWKKISDHCLAEKITLPSLRRVLCAGAAVPADLWKSSRAFLPNGRLHSPYGATEALPLATIDSSEIENLNSKSEKPHGICVGRPLPGIDLRIIAITDQSIMRVIDFRELPRGEIGEILVAGPIVTKAYDGLHWSTTMAKIFDGPVAAWHRMGDCGYLDAEGRLWLCGRKAERVRPAITVTLHTEPCEQIFRTHPRVVRCALIGLGDRPRQTPALVVETAETDPAALRAFAAELRAIALAHEATAIIEAYYFHPRFPVDVRHNAKIHRLTLAKWAATAQFYGVTERPKIIVGLPPQPPQ